MSRVSSRFIEIPLTLERRDDGGLRVYSVELPGFLLSDPDPALVISDIAPALETMLSELYQGKVTVSELYGLQQSLESCGIVSMAGPVASKKYVAQLEAA